MNEIGYFIDIERFIQWIYENNQLIGETEEKIIRPSICKEWKRYVKFPNDNSLNDVNSQITDESLKFEKINIADLLVCINNAKDIHRGQDLETITSTGKKVMLLILMGRILDGKDKNGYFTATEKKDFEVWNYLSNFNNSKKKIDAFYYFPGRAFSLEQLKSISRAYKNGINEPAIPTGIEELVRNDLVVCIDKKKELYKLNFNGCRKFLKRNK